ncbi:coagulation factor X-like [Hemitrygon akajei]|uniref:coagulation factor X-like n=1 Tax=Hemitrygon akajei TaxID=2704970 RepID=UPI003BF9D993
MANLFWAINLFLLIISLTGTESEVFVSSKKASNFLTRLRRENSFFEELKEGNLERECNEERCSHEEAREYFEDDQRTDEFWNKYVDGNQCESNPCKNQGSCSDGINLYKCTCLEGFKGINCEIEIPKLCNLNNGGCHHYCRAQHGLARCSCDSDFVLAEDGKSCVPAVRNPCGTVGPLLLTDPVPTNSSMVNDTDADLDGESGSNSLIRIVGGQDCPPGQCPWQILLLDETDTVFCGATILNERLLVSAAHCLNHTKAITAVAGEFDINLEEGTEQRQEVTMLISHPQFEKYTFDNDIAILVLKNPLQLNQHVVPICIPHKNFAEQVLMNQPNALVSGWGRLQDHGVTSTKLQRLTVPYIDRAKCIESSRFPVSQNMFCAGYSNENKDSCRGDSGGPHVTNHKNTWFLTGIVSWGEGCAQKGKYGIYTKVSKYIKWIKYVMKEMSTYPLTHN